MSRKGCPNKISTKVIFTCKTCKKQWRDYPSRIGKKFYCSYRCSSLDKIELLKARSIGNNWGSLKKITPEFRRKISLAHKGKIRPNGSKAKIGSKNPNWRGGVSPINKRIRRSSKFFQWRNRVFNRDNFTCQYCKKRGGELHPHHIRPFATFPELRFDVSNGLTLCKDCHRKTDTWSFGWCKKHALPEKQI